MSQDTPAERPAALGRRILARLVDVIVLGAIGMLVTAAVVSTVPGADDPLRMDVLPTLLLSVGLFALYLGYEAAFTAVYGATPGKLLLRLRVVEAEPVVGAPRAGAVAVLKRSSILYVSVLLNFVRWSASWAWWCRSTRSCPPWSTARATAACRTRPPEPPW